MMTQPLQVLTADSKAAETRNQREPEPSLESMELNQKKTSHASFNQVMTVVQTSLDLSNTSPDKISSPLTQLPLVESVVEEVPLCMPPHQLQLQSQSRFWFKFLISYFTAGK